VIFWLLIVDRTLAACTTSVIFLVQIPHLAKVILVVVSFLRQPPKITTASGQCYWCILVIVPALSLVWALIEEQEWPEARRIRIAKIVVLEGG